MDIKIMFFDIDGTIRNSKGIVEEETIQALHRAVDAGIEVVLCTGRSHKYAKRVANSIGLNGYLISSNGSEIYHIGRKEIIKTSPMNREDVEQVFQFSKGNNLNFLVNTIEEDYQTINESYNRSCFSSLDEIKGDINQIVVTSYNYEAMLEFLNTCKERYNNIRISGTANSLKEGNLHPDNDYYHDLNRKDVSKAHGVKILLEYLEINKENALACGDGINDVEMLQYVNYGVAMGNAIKEAKEVAPYITKKNDDLGIVAIIESILK